MPSTQVAQASPKRKRDPLPQAPLLNTPLRFAATPPPLPPPRPQTPPRTSNPHPSSGADSPRNAVADQLRHLTIAPPDPFVAFSPLSPIEGVVHKKPKLGDGTAVVETQTPALDADTHGQSATNSPSARLSPHTLLPAPGRSPSPVPFTLTWQDDEITGHLVDPSTDPDDDGTGLNGIGFRPTPAIAYARSQKRKQQLFEWKARENREARAKRSERRRRGVDATSSRETLANPDVSAAPTSPIRRTVKFAV